MTKEEYLEKQKQILKAIIANQIATVKRLDEENITVEVRSQTVRVRLNPNSVRSGTNSFFG